MKKLLIFSLMVVAGFFTANAFAEVSATTTAMISTEASPSIAAVYTGTLRPGAQSTEVVSLQAQLKNLGYYTANLDGKYGPATANAVARFQAAHNLSADGIAGTNTFASLVATSTGAIPTLPPVVINDTVDTDEDSIACTMIYQPVCAQPHRIECVKAPCPQPDPITYGNKCMMNAVNATFLYEGACKQAPIDTSNASSDEVVQPQSALAIPTLTAHSTTTLQAGSASTAVATLQASLKNLGYYTATIDGKFGPATIAAVRAYQAAKSLKVDGIVGVNTLSNLAIDSAASMNASTGAVPTR